MVTTRGGAAGLAEGSQLAGYLVGEQIGEGGMAVVYRAFDRRLRRPVALKVMSAAAADDEGFRRRFVMESQAAAAVEDPHIIPVYEAGEADGTLFIAMRYVAGGDAHSLVRRTGPLPVGRVIEIISAVAEALDAAHAAGLVHRDVKPANILLDVRPGRSDHVYLSDFGLSKPTRAVRGLTASGQFLGTPDYTAPEQMQARPTDGRADQYGLACSAFELLTGAPPFPHEQVTAVIWSHMSAPPPSLSARRRGLPPAADAVLGRALAKRPGDRYPTCRHFTEALRAALAVPRPGPDPVAAQLRRGADPAGPPPRRGRDRAPAQPRRGPEPAGPTPRPSPDPAAAAVASAAPPANPSGPSGPPGPPGPPSPGPASAPQPPSGRREVAAAGAWRHHAVPEADEAGMAADSEGFGPQSEAADPVADIPADVLQHRGGRAATLGRPAQLIAAAVAIVVAGSAATAVLLMHNHHAPTAHNVAAGIPAAGQYPIIGGSAATGPSSGHSGSSSKPGSSASQSRTPTSRASTGGGAPQATPTVGQSSSGALSAPATALMTLQSGLTYTANVTITAVNGSVQYTASEPASEDADYTISIANPTGTLAAASDEATLAVTVTVLDDVADPTITLSPGGLTVTLAYPVVKGTTCPPRPAQCP